MTYYRIVSKRGLSEYQNTGRLTPSPEQWLDYKPNTIICLFESDDPIYICERYGEMVADYREIMDGEEMYLLSIKNPPGDVNEDQSQHGLSDSRVHDGSIPADCIKPVKILRFKIRGGMSELIEVVEYE